MDEPTRPLAFHYDQVQDVLTVEGMKYSGDFFREMAGTSSERREYFRIISANEEKSIALLRVSDSLNVVDVIPKI